MRRPGDCVAGLSMRIVITCLGLLDTSTPDPESQLCKMGYGG